MSTERLSQAGHDLRRNELPDCPSDWELSGGRLGVLKATSRNNVCLQFKAVGGSLQSCKYK